MGEGMIERVEAAAGLLELLWIGHLAIVLPAVGFRDRRDALQSAATPVLAS